MKRIMIIVHGLGVVAHIYEREETKEKIIVFKTDRLKFDEKLSFYYFENGNAEEIHNPEKEVGWLFDLLKDFQTPRTEGS